MTSNIRKRNSRLIAGGAITVLAISPLKAEQILGDLPVDGGGGINLGLSVVYAVGVNLPAQPYALTDVRLSLRNYDGPADTLVSLRADNAGSPGAILAVLIDPPSLGAGINTYTFSPSGTVFLPSLTKIWLAVAADPGGNFDWIGNSPTYTGTGTLAGWVQADDGVHFGNAGDSQLGFAINGTAVPEASSSAAAAVLAGLAGLAWRRRLKAV